MRATENLPALSNFRSPGLRTLSGVKEAPDSYLLYKEKCSLKIKS